MYLQIITLSSQMVDAAKAYFPESYVEKFLGRPFFAESLAARLCISRYIGNQYLPEKDERGIPLFQDQNLWSLSHKKDCIFVGVSDSQIGIDIEYLEEKSPELLYIFPESHYEILGGKNWNNFYILWTSMEAIQKMERWENSIMEDISLKTSENIKVNISGITFQTRTLYERKGKTYQVFTDFMENKVYSVCTSQNFDYENIK